MKAEDKKVYTIYALVKDKKPYYVGCTMEGIDRYTGEKRNHFEVLELVNDLETAQARENYWILKFRSQGITLENSQHARTYRKEAEVEPDLKPQFIEFPPKVTEIIKTMEVGQSLDITNRQRASTHSLACRAFPEAEFKTRKHEDKIYLVRIA